MTKRLFTCAVLSLSALVLMLAACTQQTEISTARLDPPVFYDDEAVARARGLITEGYDLLDSSLEGALARFAEIEQLVPSGLVGPYHTACAYARTGDIEAAFEQLDILVNNGYDKPNSIRYDSDYESLTEDPRFEEIIDRARVNYETAAARFADGMPDLDSAQENFATAEELGEWFDSRNRSLRSYRPFWTAAQMTAAKIDLNVHVLAAQKELKAEDPEYDHGLARIRRSAALNSPYSRGWGAITDLVLKEVTKYEQTSPTDDNLSEAHYWAGWALTLKYDEDSPQQSEGFRRAAAHLTQVAEGTEYYGAAQAMMTVNQLQDSSADQTQATARFKEIVAGYGEDEKTGRVVSVFLYNQAARYLWPVALGMEDIDGRTITLEEYRGKVLLIDFWATWCGPCLSELPNLREVYEEYHAQGLEIVSISLDYADDTTPEDYRNWIDSAGMNWRHTYSGEAWDTDAVDRYFISGIPSAFLVGLDGDLVAWGEDLRGEALKTTVKETLGI